MLYIETETIIVRRLSSPLEWVHDLMLGSGELNWDIPGLSTLKWTDQNYKVAPLAVLLRLPVSLQVWFHAAPLELEELRRAFVACRSN